MLVQAAQILPIGLYDQFAEKFPYLRTVCPPEREFSHWNFFMTVAGVGTAMLVVPHEPGSPQHRDISGQVLEDVASWDKQAPDAMTDFFAFVRRGMDDGMESPETIGGWVLWNLKQATPDEQDLALVRPIGTFLINAFADWWAHRG